MNSIEEFDPGHFNRRAALLERLRTKAQSMGFHPLPLTQDDIHAYWITLEANELHKGKTINVSTQDLHYDGFIDVLKEIARYES
jgi:hypothetical protein